LYVNKLTGEMEVHTIYYKYYKYLEN